MCRLWQEWPLSFRELTALISLKLGEWEPVVFWAKGRFLSLIPSLRVVASFTVKNDKEKQQILTSKRLQPAEDWHFCLERHKRILQLPLQVDVQSSRQKRFQLSVLCATTHRFSYVLVEFSVSLSSQRRADALVGFGHKSHGWSLQSWIEMVQLPVTKTLNIRCCDLFGRLVACNDAITVPPNFSAFHTSIPKTKKELL